MIDTERGLLKIAVDLLAHEMLVTEVVGKIRYKRAVEKGLRPRWEYEDKPGDVVHIEGARAECAWAKGLGLYWTMGIDTYKGVPDVLPNWEVRLSTFKSYPKDPADGLIGYVLGGGARYLLMGWMSVAEAQRTPLSDPGDRDAPAHFPPLYLLHDMRELTERE